MAKGHCTLLLSSKFYRQSLCSRYPKDGLPDNGGIQYKLPHTAQTALTCRAGRLTGNVGIVCSGS